jgi:hypothetical protein
MIKRIQEGDSLGDIRHPDILTDIGRKVSAGMTWAEIASTIEQEYGIKCTPAYVEKIYGRYAVRRSEILNGDSLLKEQVKQEILDWKSQLGKINTQTWEILNNMEMKPEMKLKAMAEVRQQLELQNKIMERMENTFTSKAMNSMDITRLVFSQLAQLEKDGMIKILRMPGLAKDASFSVKPVATPNVPEEELKNYIDERVEKTVEEDDQDG